MATPKLPPMMTPPHEPELPSWAIAEGEEGGARSLASNLEAMKRYSKEFSECVALFEISQGSAQGFDLWHAWIFIAAKAAIVALYNYRMAMDGAMAARRSCRSWEKQLDNSALEATRTKFREAFPGTRELRQTVLHGSERFSNEERTASNRITKGVTRAHYQIAPGSNAIVDANIINSTYSCLFGGDLHELEVHRDKAVELVGITGEFFAPFAALAEKLGPRSQPR